MSQPILSYPTTILKPHQFITPLRHQSSPQALQIASSPFSNHMPLSGFPTRILKPHQFVTPLRYQSSPESLQIASNPFSNHMPLPGLPTRILKPHQFVTPQRYQSSPESLQIASSPVLDLNNLNRSPFQGWPSSSHGAFRSVIVGEMLELSFFMSMCE